MTRHAILFAAAAPFLTAAFLGRAGGPQQPQPQPPPDLQAPGPPRTGTGVIIGSVVEAATGQTLGGAIVTIGGRGVPPQRVMVDARGRFAFRDLPAGPIVVSAFKPGYFGGAAGARQPSSPGHPIDLADGQRLVDVTLPLWRFGAISGAVIGESNEPFAGLAIHALRRALVGGAWRLVDHTASVTDDRGRYRLSGLTQGDYVVAVRPDPDRETPLLMTMLFANPATAMDILAGTMSAGREVPELDARVRSYPITFFPAATSAERATTVAVNVDQERAGIDIRVKPQRVVRVSGTVTSTNEALEGLTIRLVPADSGNHRLPLDVATAICGLDGRFTFTGVSPGRYVIAVMRAPMPAGNTPPNPAGPAVQPNPPGPPPGGRPGGAGAPPLFAPPLPAEPTLWASVPLTVGTTDVSGIAVPLHRGVAVRGRVLFDGANSAPPPDQLAQITLRLEADDQPASSTSSIWRGRVEPDGRFATIGVPPGRYFVRASTLPRGWTLQSAMSGGRDVLDVPLDIGALDVNDVTILLVDRPLGTLTGFVRGAGETADPNTAVLVFPTDRQAWTDTSAAARRLRIFRPTTAGQYAIQGLPAGEYFVIAVPDNVPSEWQDAKRLETWAGRATRVQLGGEMRALDLRTVR